MITRWRRSVTPPPPPQPAAGDPDRLWLDPAAAALTTARPGPAGDGRRRWHPGPTPPAAVPVWGIVTTDRAPDTRDPHIPGVTFWLYRMWGRDATTGHLYLLYVGETGQRPAERLAQHLTDPDAPSRFWRHLIYAWEVHPHPYPSRAAARAAEAKAVAVEWPTQNIQLQTTANRRYALRAYRPAKRALRLIGPTRAAFFTAITAGGYWLTFTAPPGPTWVETARWTAPPLLAAATITLAALGPRRRRRRAFTPTTTTRYRRPRR